MPFRTAPYPVTPTLSVEGDHVRVMDVGKAAASKTFVGVEGGWVSFVGGGGVTHCAVAHRRCRAGRPVTGAVDCLDANRVGRGALRPDSE